MIDYKQHKKNTIALLQSNAKPSELYKYFRSFDDLKVSCVDIVAFNEACGFTSEFKDAMNNGNDLPEWL